MSFSDISTLAEAEHFAALHGIRVTPSDRSNIQKAQQSEQQRLRQLAHDTPQQGSILTRLVEVFNRLYPRFLESLTHIGDVILTLTQTIIISFGIPIVLFLLLIVEQQRVVGGIHLFEYDLTLASFAAWALVLLNLTLEFAVVYIEQNSGYQDERPLRFSLRLWRRQLAYTLGLGESWQEQVGSPALRFRRLLTLITWTILALALAGSMEIVIAQTTGAWYVAIAHIFLQSSLLDMLTWSGGLLFAAAAVFSVQGLTRYIAVRCVDILSRMESHEEQDGNEMQESLENVAVQYILSKVAAKHPELVGEVAASLPVPLALTQDNA